MAPRGEAEKKGSVFTSRGPERPDGGKTSGEGPYCKIGNQRKGNQVINGQKGSQRPLTQKNNKTVTRKQLKMSSK